jgi:hypothetical protein
MMVPTDQPTPEFLAQLHLAPAQVGKSLTLWPLVLNDALAAPESTAYVSLRCARGSGKLRVDEVGESEHVPHLRVTNSGDVATLFLFDEEIRGSKRNRIAKSSFLVAAHSETVLDVSHTELGRWQHYRGARPESSDEVVSLHLRRKLAKPLRVSRTRGRRFAAGRHAARVEVEHRPGHAGVESPVRSFADYRDDRSADIEALREAFHPIACQVGFVACIGGEVIGLEAIGRPEVFRSNFDAMLRFYAIDASLAQRRNPRVGVDRAPRFQEPEDFIDALAKARNEREPSLGLGCDYRIRGEQVAGCALADGSLVHLTAFPAAS